MPQLRHREAAREVERVYAIEQRGVVARRAELDDGAAAAVEKVFFLREVDVEVENSKTLSLSLSLLKKHHTKKKSPHSVK